MLLNKMNDLFMGQDMQAVFASLIRATAKMTSTSTEPKALEYAIEALKQAHANELQRPKKAN